MNCKLCSKKLTSKDKYFNQYNICKNCLDKGKYNSLKLQSIYRSLKTGRAVK